MQKLRPAIVGYLIGTFLWYSLAYLVGLETGARVSAGVLGAAAGIAIAILVDRNAAMLARP